MTHGLSPRFIDNPAIRGRETHYIEIEIDAARILQSWRESLFSFEWMRPDGRIKPASDLSAADQQRRAEVERKLAAGEALEKPVLGIGLLDNVEIGAGRAIFLTLAALGMDRLPVHIPKSHEADFASFLYGAPPARTRKGKKGESGNIMLYILLAIVLLAALSLALTKGGGFAGGAVAQDKQKLMATEIIDYGDVLSKATTQLRLRGIAFNQLSFAATGMAAAYGTPGASPTSELFNTQGGGITLKPPPDEAMVTPGPYIFTAANEIAGIGTTCGNNGCTDLLMVAGPLQQAVCAEIDALIPVSTTSGLPPVATAFDTTTLYAGTATYSDTVGNDSDSAGLYGKTAGCLESASQYYYYQVLLAQ
jgi:hypothetical protein